MGIRSISFLRGEETCSPLSHTEEYPLYQGATLKTECLALDLLKGVDYPLCSFRLGVSECPDLPAALLIQARPPGSKKKDLGRKCLLSIVPVTSPEGWRKGWQILECAWKHSSKQRRCGIMLKCVHFDTNWLLTSPCDFDNFIPMQILFPHP